MSKKSPFKKISDLEKDIDAFINTYGGSIYNNSKKVSTLFEITCYNDILKFYENNGYTLTVQQLEKKTKKFRYKLSPTGIPTNFSYFIATKQVVKNRKKIPLKHQIRHNISLQSSFDKDIFLTPDIVICSDSIQPAKNSTFYKGKKIFYFLPNNSIFSFAEAKHYTPFPELLFSFIGTVNELMPQALKKGNKKILSQHLAPSLVVSGAGNQHIQRIKDNLEKRYQINIFLGLFSVSNQIYSNNSVNLI